MLGTLVAQVNLTLFSAERGPHDALAEAAFSSAGYDGLEAAEKFSCWKNSCLCSLQWARYHSSISSKSGPNTVNSMTGRTDYRLNPVVEWKRGG